MCIHASTCCDGNRGVTRQLMKKSVPGQLNMKGAHEETALSDTEVYASAIAKLVFMLLATSICCLPYGPPHQQSKKRWRGASNTAVDPLKATSETQDYWRSVFPENGE